MNPKNEFVCIVFWWGVGEEEEEEEGAVGDPKRQSLFFMSKRKYEGCQAD